MAWMPKARTGCIILSGSLGFGAGAEHAGHAGAVDVGVDQPGAQAHRCEGGGEVDGDGGFADAALARCDGHDAADGGEELLAGSGPRRGRASCPGGGSAQRVWGLAVGGEHDGGVLHARLAAQQGGGFLLLRTPCGRPWRGRRAGPGGPGRLWPAGPRPGWLPRCLARPGPPPRGVRPSACPRPCPALSKWRAAVHMRGAWRGVWAVVLTLPTRRPLELYLPHALRSEPVEPWRQRRAPAQPPDQGAVGTGGGGGGGGQLPPEVERLVAQWRALLARFLAAAGGSGGGGAAGVALLVAGLVAARGCVAGDRVLPGGAG